MDKFIQIGEKCGLEEEKLLEFVREQLKLEEEKDENVENLRRKEGGKRKRKKKNVDNWKRKKKKNVDNWKRKEKKSIGS